MWVVIESRGSLSGSGELVSASTQVTGPFGSEAEALTFAAMHRGVGVLIGRVVSEVTAPPDGWFDAAAEGRLRLFQQREQRGLS